MARVGRARASASVINKCRPLAAHLFPDGLCVKQPDNSWHHSLRSRDSLETAFRNTKTTNTRPTWIKIERYTKTGVCVCARARTCVCARAHTHAHNTHTFTHTHTHTFTHTHTHTHIHTHTFTFAHTQLNSMWSSPHIHYSRRVDQARKAARHLRRPPTLHSRDSPAGGAYLCP